MTIYQKELLRQLSNLGCAGYEDDQSGMLNITMDGLPLCIAGKKCDLYWDKENVALPERRKAVDALCKAADLVREYSDRQLFTRIPRRSDPFSQQ